MNRQPKQSKWFHCFLIYFALWAFAALMALDGARYISHAVENAPQYGGVIIVLGVLLFLVGLFAIKTRFDLAAFRAKAPKELLIVFLAAAAIILANQLVIYISAEDNSRSSLLSAFILACWGIALYRYYHAQEDLFRN